LKLARFVTVTLPVCVIPPPVTSEKLLLTTFAESMLTPAKLLILTLPLVVLLTARLDTRVSIAFAAPMPLPEVRLRVDESIRRATLARLGLEAAPRAAALCPGAEYGPAKRWPVTHFAELAKSLAAKGYAVWLVGSAKDRELGEAIVELSGNGCRNLCGKTSLDEAVDVLASSEVVVSNDSGLMHVAAALGKRLVALYGSSTPDYTPPLSGNATTLWLGLSCSPCFRRECPLGHFNCMMQLTPERVCSAIEFDKIGRDTR